MKRIFLLIGMLFFTVSTPAMAKEREYQLALHVLDINKGNVATDVSIELFKQDKNGEWNLIETVKTKQEGPIDNLLSLKQDNRGVYKVRVHSKPYLEKNNYKPIFEYVDIIVNITNKEQYHIPVLLSGNGYTTYRGR